MPNQLNEVSAREGATHRSDAELAREARLVQSAVNLTAVANSFARLCTELTRRGLDTQQVYDHPAVIMFANKITDMTRVDNDKRVFEAYEWAYDQADKEVAK